MLSWNQSFFISVLGTLCFALKASALSKEWEEALTTVLAHDWRQHPQGSQGKGLPVVVYFQLFVHSFDSVNVTRMEYSATITLVQKWWDSRMIYNKIPGLERMELDARALDSVWVPAVYFSNSKADLLHKLTLMNKLMHVYPDGEVIYSMEVSVVLHCSMDLRKYPFDSQVCSMTLESYSYSTSEVVLQWNDKNPVGMNKDLQLPEFTIKQGKHETCDRRYPGFANETFGCLRADFYLKRNHGYHFIQLYGPSILVVILSWISFWLDIYSAPARVMLGILTLQTLTTQAANMKTHLPKVSYVKAIDVWIATCLVFTFAAFLEFAYVNVKARQRSQPPSNSKSTALPMSSRPTIFDNSVIPNREKDYTMEEVQGCSSWLLVAKWAKDLWNGIFSQEAFGNSQEKARWIDRVSRLAFPSAFAAFNIVYWTFYLLWEPEDTEP